MVKAILIFLALFVLHLNAQDGASVCKEGLTLGDIGGTWSGTRVSVLVTNATTPEDVVFLCLDDVSEECLLDLEANQQALSFNISADTAVLDYDLFLDLGAGFPGCNEDGIFPFGTYKASFTNVTFENNKLGYVPSNYTPIYDAYCMHWCIYEEGGVIKASITQIMNYQNEDPSILFEEFPFECAVEELDEITECSIDWTSFSEPTTLIYNDTFTLECSGGECLNLLSTSNDVVVGSIPGKDDDESEDNASEDELEGDVDDETVESAGVSDILFSLNGKVYLYSLFIAIISIAILMV